PIEDLIEHLLIQRFKIAGVDHFDRKLICQRLFADAVDISAIGDDTHLWITVSAPSLPGTERCLYLSFGVWDISARITNAERMLLSKRFPQQRTGLIRIFGL